MQTLALINSDYAEIINSCVKGAEIKTIRNFLSFQAFLKREMQLYRHCKTLILQRSVISEKDNELSDLIKQFQIIYDDVKIIVIYPGATESSPDFIKSLLKLDIYDLVVSVDEQDQKEELIQSVSDAGRDALIWIRIFPELVEAPIEEKIEKKKLFPKKAVMIAACAALILCLGAFAALSSGDKDKPSVSAVHETESRIETEKISSRSTTIRMTSGKAETSSSISSSTATAISSYGVTSTSSSQQTTTTSAETTTTTSKAANTTTSKTTTTTTTTTKATTTTSKATTKKQTASQVTTTVKHKTTTTAKPKTTTTTTSKATTTTRKATTTTVKTTTAQVINVTGIRLRTDYANNDVTLSVGGSTTIYAVITPENATNKTVSWTSNRPDIAMVDPTGKITAVGKGKAIIQATTDDGSLTAACMVTVS